MPDPAVHDAASGRPSTSSSPSPSSSNAAAGGPIAASPGITPTSDHADESAAAPSVKPSPSSSPSTSSVTTPRPSLLSRLSTPLHFPLPLRSRNRNLADFHIRCDEPHKKYSAGDSVRGAVILALVKPLRITHLVVALHGYVRVLKEPTSVAKAQNVTILPPPGSSRRPEYRGNGVTSLFQDEQILSGEGRIEPGKYEFGFDLVFPGKRLPSSIDFERGTISYTITATLTRPVSMAATSTCERKVTLVQQIDVGLLSAPRPRTIFLEPISKRTRRKKPKPSEMASGALPPPENNDLTSEAGSVITEGSNRGETNNRHAPADSTASDMHSEISVESRRSGMSSASRATGEFRQLSHVGSTLTSAAKQQYVDDKTITATIELIKGGCLPGDTVTVRVTVQHIKRVKSMTGVIVTLFRQSKIDTHPPKSIMSHEGSRRRLTKQDPSVPRYRTGIGGLSFYSSGSISVFRKDLDQNAAPLIIDPATLQATVTVSVRVPDDAFPTIKGVPGDMISFKYLAEVIVDLGGRLTTQLTGGTSSLSRLGTPGGHNADQNPMLPFGHQRGTNIADTSQVRAQKGVISVSLETVVGTTDSVKLRQPGKSNTTRSRTIRIADEEGGDEDEEEDVDEDEYEYEEDDDGDGGDITRRDTITRGKAPAYANGHSYSSPRERNHDYTSPPPHPPDDLRLTWAPTTASSSRLPHADRNYSLYAPHHPPPPLPPPSGAAPSYIPPPRVASEASMTEKERILQAEMRLLPSQPPAGPVTVADEEDIYGAEDVVRTPVATPTVPVFHAVEAEPSAPPVEDVIDAGLLPAATSSGSPPRDKQELERQRLMQEASAPPEFPSDMMTEVSAPHASASASAPPLAVEPTAPDLDEDDITESYEGYGVGAGSSSSGVGVSEQLPAYQR